MKMLTTEGIAFDSLTDTKMVSLASTNGVYCLSYFLKSEETRDKYKSQKCLFHRLRCYSWKGPCGPFCAFSVNDSRIQSVANLCEIQTFLENKLWDQCACVRRAPPAKMFWQNPASSLSAKHSLPISACSSWAGWQKNPLPHFPS